MTTATLEEKVHWHLRWNHYPPVDAEYEPVLVQAIEACEADDTERLIDGPHGGHAEAWKVLEAFHWQQDY